MFITRALYFGQEAAKRNYTLQIGNIVRAAYERLGEVPVVVGETGVPMDMKCVCVVDRERGADVCLVRGKRSGRGTLDGRNG